MQTLDVLFQTIHGMLVALEAAIEFFQMLQLSPYTERGGFDLLKNIDAEGMILVRITDVRDLPPQGGYVSQRGIFASEFG